ncbi:single-stranded DNA-binding protein [Candidatus Saganbacteria bacterium]|uniref:Single-stranded DNA-binding protein n=1 Tax=Candidatus Saganbacteria bacterium TaxID=2575572 RepID=A0A9D6ULM4_UNCSA|nr:single-stranded DNA-binding protein [Candidatus Saganbacteria bacterium]
MYNKAFLIGNLTRDPELRYTSSGIPVARFAVAVNRFQAKGAETGKPEVDFINVVAWRRLAEICGEYLKKGRPVALEGRLQIRSFTGRDGQKRTMAEVVADNMQMLGRKTESAADTAVRPVPLADNEAIEIEKKLSGEEAPF